MTSGKNKKKEWKMNAGHRQGRVQVRLLQRRQQQPLVCLTRHDLPLSQTLCCDRAPGGGGIEVAAAARAVLGRAAVLKSRYGRQVEKGHGRALDCFVDVPTALAGCHCRSRLQGETLGWFGCMLWLGAAATNWVGYATLPSNQTLVGRTCRATQCLTTDPTHVPSSQFCNCKLTAPTGERLHPTVDKVTWRPGACSVRQSILAQRGIITSHS